MIALIFMKDKNTTKEKINYNNSKEFKIIIKSYIRKLEDDCTELNTTFKERLNQRNQLIPFKEELISRYAENEYLFKTKISSLKRFALQEVFFRTEAKLLEEEKQKINEEIFNDSIEKLSKLHIVGFEPGESIKKKIIKKCQAKYGQHTENYTELKNKNRNISLTANEEYNEYMKVFIDPDNVSIEMKRLNKRKQIQLEVLKEFAESNTRYIDKRTEYKLYELHKSNLKKYEKQIDLKSSQLNTEFNSSNLNSIYESLTLPTNYYSKSSNVDVDNNQNTLDKQNLVNNIISSSNVNFNNNNNYISNSIQNTSDVNFLPLKNNISNNSIFDLNWESNNSFYSEYNYNKNNKTNVDIECLNNNKIPDKNHTDSNIFNQNIPNIEEFKEKKILKVKDILKLQSNNIEDHTTSILENINLYKERKLNEYKNLISKDVINENNNNLTNKNIFKLTILNDLIYNFNKNKSLSIHENDILSYLIHSIKSIKDQNEISQNNIESKIDISDNLNEHFDLNNNYGLKHNNVNNNLDSKVSEDLLNVMNENEKEIKRFLTIILNNKDDSCDTQKLLIDAQVDNCNNFVISLYKLFNNDSLIKSFTKYLY